MSQCMFGWREELSVGNDIMDLQHRELITRITDIVTSLEDSGSKDISSMISYLNEYIFDHFVLEEKIMVQTGYPDFYSHRDEHSHYVKFIFKLKQKPVITAEMLGELQTELAGWFLDHILKTDLRMAEHVSKYTKSLATCTTK